MAKAKATGVTFDAVRKIGLTLPGSEEATAWGTPVLKVHGRIFTGIPINKSAEPGSIMFSVDFAARDAMIEGQPDVYYTASHYETYPCVLARQSRLDLDVLEDLVRMAHQVLGEPAEEASARREGATIHETLGTWGAPFRPPPEPSCSGRRIAHRLHVTDRRAPTWFTGLLLLVWLVAGAAAFLPFASDTSPWNALTVRVPGDQGNWWHVLVGAPFFLALPMIWLRLRSLSSKPLSTPAGRRVIWIAVGLSALGTILVEMPFLLHRAGTSELQRLSIIALGLGIIVVSGTLVFLRRRAIPPTRACLAGLNAAYLANASLCLIVYGASTAEVRPQSGWMVTIVIVWPMLLELTWILADAF